MSNAREKSREKYIASILLLIMMSVMLFPQTVIAAGHEEDSSERCEVCGEDHQPDELENYIKSNIAVISVIDDTNKEVDSDNTHEGNTLTSVIKEVIQPSGRGVIKREISYLEDVESDFAAGVKELGSITGFTLDEGDITRKDSGDGDDEEKENTTSKKSGDEINVLIYHSHTREAFAESKNPEWADVPEESIAAVGVELAEELRKNGINVIHDTRMHGEENYTDSYRDSQKTVEYYLKEYGEFDLIIDVHRDSVDNKSNVTTTINGQNAAQAMFVVSTQSPNYDSMMMHVEGIIETTDEKYPGLIRDRSVFEYQKGSNYFNQHLDENVILVEIGAHVNTLEEAKYTARLLGDSIATYLIEK